MCGTKETWRLRDAQNVARRSTQTILDLLKNVCFICFVLFLVQKAKSEIFSLKKELQ